MRSGKETKKKIFDAAAELFSIYGYDNVSTRQISERVGITEGGIYRHYDSKKSILDEIFAAFKERVKGYFLTKAQADRYIQTDTPREFLMRCGTICFHEADQPFLAHAYRIAYREQLVNPVATELIISLLYEAGADSIQYMLDSLVKRGSIPAVNTRVFALLWMQAMLATASIWVTHFFSGKKKLEKIEKEYADVCSQLVEMLLSGKTV